MSQEKSPEASLVTFLLYVIAFLLFFFPGCSENARTRAWGNDMLLELPCGEKLITSTWEDHDINYLTRPMRPGESAETYKLRAEDNWYFIYPAGVLTIKECGSAPAEVSLLGESPSPTLC